MDPTTPPLGQRSADPSRDNGRTRDGAAVRAAIAYALVLLGPAAAWLAWISWSVGKASDALHVACFASVAVGCVLAGGLAPRRTTHLVAVAVLAVLATMTTLTWWWSSADSSGLFVVGLVLALPLVATAALLLLMLGRRLARPRAQSGHERGA